MPTLSSFSALVTPIATALDRLYRGRLARVLGSDSGLLERAHAALAELEGRPDASASAALEAAAEAALAALRGTDDAGGWQRVLLLADRWMRSTATELMDKPSTPALVRKIEMSALDWQNRVVGSYKQWAGMLAEILGGSDRPHVYDLGAGSGGFLRYVGGSAKYASMRLTSSDVNPKFVEAGRTAAEKTKAKVTFETRDASDLRSLRGTVDLFVSTQSAHHFSPGGLVQMIREAVAAAPQGILVVDLRRSATLAVVGALADCVTAPFPPLMYDGILSFRRAYLPSEMELLARLAGAAHVDAYAQAPAHFVMHARGLAAAQSA